MLRMSLQSSNNKSLQLEFSKQSKNNKWMPSHLWPRSIYKLLAFCTTYLRETAFSKLIIIKSKNRSFLQNVDMSFVLCCLVSIYKWMICVKIINGIHPVNCAWEVVLTELFFVNFFRQGLLFPLRCSFIAVYLLSWIVCKQLLSTLLLWYIPFTVPKTIAGPNILSLICGLFKNMTWTLFSQKFNTVQCIKWS